MDKGGSVAQAHDAKVDIDWEHGYSVVDNSADEAEFARQVAVDLVGEGKVAECAPIPGSEDFAYFLEHKLGCLLRLGNGENSAFLHNSKYDFNDASLTAGAALWARLAERYLQA